MEYAKRRKNNADSCVSSYEWGLAFVFTRILGVAVLEAAQLAVLPPAMIGAAGGIGGDAKDDEEEE